MIDVNNLKELEQKISTGPSVIDFWAPWCGQCKAMMPSIEEISEENSDITFVRVNTEGNEPITDKYGVQSLPTLVFLKSGDEVSRLTGMKPRSLILREIDRIKQ